MQTKIKYRDTEYSMKENTLALKQASIPIMYKFNTLQAKHLDTIDMGPCRYYQDKILDYEETIEQLKALNPDEIYHNEQTNAQKIEELTEKISALDDELKNDKAAQIALTEYKRAEDLIIRDIALDVEIMEDVFNKLLEGNPGNIDFEAEEYEKFALEVLANFFSKMPRNKKRLKS